MDNLIETVDRVLARNRKPTIKTEQHYSDQWSAVDDNTYDGPGSPVGWGSTEQEAIVDLTEQMDARNLVEFEGYFRSQEFVENTLGLRAALAKLGDSTCSYCGEPATANTSDGVQVCVDCYNVCRQNDDMTWAEYRGEVN